MTDLDHELDYELRRLPAPRAPGTLLPRVLQAVSELESRPWYSRAWVTWPRELQLASAVMLALLIAGLWSLAPAGEQWVGDAVSPAANAVSARLAAAADWIGQAATLGRLLWQILIQPIAFYFLALMIAATVIGALFWTAVNRLALGGASPQ